MMILKRWWRIIELHGWESYLALREIILVPAGLCSWSIGFSKSFEVVLRVAPGVPSSPGNIKIQIFASYSYDHVIELSSEPTMTTMLLRMHSLHRRPIEALGVQGIDIPYADVMKRIPEPELMNGNRSRLCLRIS